MGNTHAHRRAAPPEEAVGDAYMPSSPPGVPVMYSQQSPVESLKPHDELHGSRSLATEYYGLAGWPAQPKLVPVVIQWSHGGSNVEVEGSFDSWTTRSKLQRTGKDFSIVKLLPPGVYQYKFIVDGEWRYDHTQPACIDDQGNINNVKEVYEYVPENLEGVSGFDPPPSPPASYTNPHPVAEDYAKEPPALPPHMALTLLNVPPTQEAVLPRPQHVILNHIYCQRGSSVSGLVVGTTYRYKAKYVTTLLYKPRRGRLASAPQPVPQPQ